MTLTEFIAALEGVRLKAYDIEPDINGPDTIGVGHLITDDEHETGMIWIGGQQINWRQGMTRMQALGLLAQDLKEFSACIDHSVAVPLAPNQRIALVSFSYNVGCGAFTRSTLLKRLNAGEYDAVPGELGRWIKNNGKVVKGLINRRAKEAAMWRGEVDV